MFYKEIKLIAAHRVLKSLNKSYIKWNGKNSAPSYTWVKFSKIKQENRLFSNQLLRDAAFLLKKNGHADILDNTRDIFDIEVGMLKDHFHECETAYREKFYIWQFLKSWKGLLLTIGSLATATLSIWALLRLIRELWQKVSP